MTEQAKTPRKTIDAYAEDRAKLNALKAPPKFTFTGSGVDNDYRVHEKVEFLLGMVGHLLRRVDALEAELEARDSAPSA